jgi:hypothetical protein
MQNSAISTAKSYAVKRDRKEDNINKPSFPGIQKANDDVREREKPVILPNCNYVRAYQPKSLSVTQVSMQTASNEQVNFAM